MPRLLALDATGRRCAVALFEDGALQASRDEPMERGHAERLFPLIAATLTDAGAAPCDVDAFVACAGPCGFTGARIAVAAARGLALATGKPSIGVDWLAALGAAAPGAVVVSLPASGGWATQRFLDGAPKGPPALLAEDDAARGARPGETAIGAAAIDEHGLAPLALLAERLLRSGAPAPAAPLYLRPPDALPSRHVAPALLDRA